MERKRALVIASLTLLLCLPVAFVVAQSGGAYDVAWHTVDAGGLTSGSGGSYTLDATAGQPDAALLTGGGYSLGGGFWSGGAAVVQHEVYLPLILR
jgi:hypothetical protein